MRKRGTEDKQDTVKKVFETESGQVLKTEHSNPTGYDREEVIKNLPQLYERTFSLAQNLPQTPDHLRLLPPSKANEQYGIITVDLICKYLGDKPAMGPLSEIPNNPIRSAALNAGFGVLFFGIMVAPFVVSDVWAAAQDSSVVPWFVQTWLGNIAAAPPSVVYPAQTLSGFKAMQYLKEAVQTIANRKQTQKDLDEALLHNRHAQELFDSQMRAFDDISQTCKTLYGILYEREFPQAPAPEKIDDTKAALSLRMYPYPDIVKRISAIVTTESEHSPVQRDWVHAIVNWTGAASETGLVIASVYFAGVNNHQDSTFFWNLQDLCKATIRKVFEISETDMPPKTDSHFGKVLRSCFISSIISSWSQPDLSELLLSCIDFSRDNLRRRYLIETVWRELTQDLNLSLIPPDVVEKVDGRLFHQMIMFHMFDRPNQSETSDEKLLQGADMTIDNAVDSLEAATKDAMLQQKDEPLFKWLATIINYTVAKTVDQLLKLTESTAQTSLVAELQNLGIRYVDAIDRLRSLFLTRLPNREHVLAPIPKMRFEFSTRLLTGLDNTKMAHSQETQAFLRETLLNPYPFERPMSHPKRQRNYSAL